MRAGDGKLNIELYKGLKVVKFDRKMYLNFSNFRGRTLAGGTSLGPKTGTSVGWGGGGVAKFLPDGGTPQSPQEKKPAIMHIIVHNLQTLFESTEILEESCFCLYLLIRRC